MQRLTLLFFFLFIPTLINIGCSETENITDTKSVTRQPQIDPTKIVVIPDENLAKSIREALELPEETEITAGQLATLEFLSCSGRIKDWTGLEYATQLEHLSLRYCLRFISPITGEIQGSIWDQDKETADLTPLAGLKNLYLDLANNGIKDLTPLKVLKNLNGLDLNENNIEDLSPLAELKQLTSLYLYNWGESNIKDITPLAGLKQLTYLHISGSFDNITPLAELKQLTLLILNGSLNDITPLAGLKQLTTLYLQNNEISDIAPLTGLKQLTELNLSYNQISDVTPLTELINLQKLWLQGNPIADKTPLVELRKKNPNVQIDILD